MDVTERLQRLSPEKRAQLALRLASARLPNAQKSMPLFHIQPDSPHRYEQFPLSDIQQAYFIGRSEGVELGNIGCHYYFEVDLQDWDRARFEAALQKLIERHEMLRCIVVPEGRQQILQCVPPYRVECLDLCGQEPEAVDAQLEAVRRTMSHHVHRTDLWPLFEFRASLLHSQRTRLHIGIDLLIADGRSLEILFSELARLYRHPNAILPPLELSFRDYLLACNTLEDTDTFRESRAYWLKRIPTLPPSPELPLAVNPAMVTRPGFKRRHTQIEAAVWQTLKEKAARIKVTPASLLLAAFAEVLAIWSKHPRFTISLTLFNRLPFHRQVNDILGDFTAVNLLEVDNAKPEAFEARARQLQEQLWQDLDHRYFSGVQVMRELARVQGVGPRAIMPVVFTSLLNLGDGNEETTWAGHLGRTVFAISQTPQVYLDNMVHEDRGELVINWDAIDELFPSELLDHLFKAYRTLLEQLAFDEASWRRTLAESTRKLIPTAQMALFQRVNDTQAPLTDALLHTPFLQQVQERPQQVAVCTPMRRLTYAELYRHACRVEEELLHRNVQPNQFVAVVMEKGWEQIVAVLGILFAGGAYMPIEPDVPAERQHYLIENGDVKLVLTQAAVQQPVSVPAGVEVLIVDQLQPAHASAPVPRRRQKPEDLAYVIYTSGSTGLPKGVMIDHRGAMNTVLDINQRFGIGPQDRVLALSRLNFDLSVYDIFGLLAVGGTIVMPTAALAQDAAHWAQLIVAEQVTVWNTVPALMQLLVEEVGHGAKIGQSLRVIMMSGDWIPVPLPGEIHRMLPQARIISLGGATEASIWSILYPIEQVDPHWKSIPYGKPMLNQSFHVLSHVQTPCPVWVPGQLYIRGIGLAKGYWRDAQKTHASFVQDPHTGERLYRTGDWGRYLPDGNIEFLGREDSQVKVQGYRIELGEIEVQLQKYEGIEKCVVVVRQDNPGERRLVGYVVAKPGAQLEPAAIREYLRTKLAEYMVPSAIVILDWLPLTPNGKVDRKALPAVARPSTAAASSAIQPRDMLELQLLKLWEKVLHVRPVGLQDNFFDLGGHSLTALRLFAELRKMTGHTLALSTLFQAPTVEKLAELLQIDGWSYSWKSLVPIQAGGSKPPFYCVHGGGGNVLLFHDLARLLGKDYPFYGLQAQGLDGSKDYLTSIEDMAAHYLKEIRALQPEGPYYLGGFCMGGQVAFEMAQQLRQDGQRVALLVMVDTYNFKGVALHLSFGGRISHARQKMIFHVRNFARLSLQEKGTYLGKKFQEAWDREFKKASVKISNLCKMGLVGNKNKQVEVFIEHINDKAYFSYVPNVYPGQVTIFKPQRNYTYMLDPQYGWGDVVTGGLECIELPVDPGGIFIEPYVQTLADGLRARIDEAVRGEERAATAQDHANVVESIDAIEGAEDHPVAQTRVVFTVTQ